MQFVSDLERRRALRCRWDAGRFEIEGPLPGWPLKLANKKLKQESNKTEQQPP